MQKAPVITTATTWLAPSFASVTKATSWLKTRSPAKVHTHAHYMHKCNHPHANTFPVVNAHWLVLLIVYFCACMFSAQISMSAVCPATCVSTSVLTIQEVTLVSVHQDISSRQTGCVKVWQSAPFLPPINQFFIYFLCSFVYYLSHTPVSVFQHNKLHKLVYVDINSLRITAGYSSCHHLFNL